MAHILLPQKLLAIRTFLGFTQVQLAESLQSKIPPRRGRSYNMHPGNIS